MVRLDVKLAARRKAEGRPEYLLGLHELLRRLQLEPDLDSVDHRPAADSIDIHIRHERDSTLKAALGSDVSDFAEAEQQRSPARILCEGDDGRLVHNGRLAGLSPMPQEGPRGGTWPGMGGSSPPPSSPMSAASNLRASAKTLGIVGQSDRARVRARRLR